MPHPLTREQIVRGLRDYRSGVTAGGEHLMESAADAIEQLTTDRELLHKAVSTKGWTCFHCWETFTDKEKASVHFGPWAENVNHPRCTPQGLRRALDAANAALLAKTEECERFRGALATTSGKLLVATAECAALAKDAERYRWLRNFGDAYVDGEQPHGFLAVYYDGLHLQQDAELDAIVDAAIALPPAQEQPK